MPLWLRRVLWGGAGLLIVLVALAIWLVATFDANRYKGVAIDWVKTNRQRTLAIDGPIELSVFPRLAVRLSRVRLSEVGKPDEFAAIDEAGLAVDVLPLLRGELVVGRVQARGVRVAYQRDAKGRSNLDDLLQPAAPSEPTTAQRPLRFDIDSVDLADVRARVKDDSAGLDGELLLKSLRSGRLADKVESPVKLAMLLDLKAPAVKGELSGDTRLTLDLAAKSVSLRDMTLAFNGEAPGARAIDAALKGSLVWDGAKSALDAQKLDVRLSAAVGNIKLAGSTLTIDHFAFDAPRKSLDLRKLRSRVSGSQDGQPLKLELDWPELSVSGNTLGGSAFSGAVSRGGDTPFEARFKSGAPSGNFDAIRLPGIEAQLTGQAGQRKLAGALHADLTFKPAQHVTSWSATGQLDDNTFATDGTLNSSGTTPHVVAKARFDSLDLNRVLKPGSAPAKAPAAPSNTPVDLAGLRSVNGQFGLLAGSLAYQHYRVTDARLAATLDGGLLRVTELKGKAWGGQLDITAVADARASRVGFKGSASGVNVNALVKDVAQKDWIEGTGRVTLDVDTTGRSTDEMKSHLKGSAALQVRDGAIKGINLAKALRETQAAISMRQDAARKANQTEKTDFSELSATFQINDGVARNKDLDLKSPFLRLGGEGAIDVGRGRIDYVARATLAPTAKGQGGAELAALKGLTVPVRLAGPFESLDWKIEWSAVVAGAVTNQLKDKLGQQLGQQLGLKPSAGAASSASPEDVLRNKLKGLFK